ncbi:MAG TPA: OsmC family protein [Verrucomicrobiae bacterium]|nr:OsmC family protein [Verrucomicrobiae bacterium]
MEIRVQHLDKVKFSAIVRGHRIVCDQPPGNGGADEGPTPPEFLLISLGTCAGFYAAQYLKNHGLSQQGLEVTVSADKVPAPARLGKFRIEVQTPGLPVEHQAGVLRAVNACLIKNTLAQPPVIETVLHTEVLSAA